ncbi:MAG: hypothetical protein U0166_11810 [Acidobacteriota bacterium]
MSREHRTDPASTYRSARALGIAGILVAVLPAAALANVPLPATFLLMWPLWLAIKTFALSFVGVVLIEASVLRLGFRIPIGRALITGLAANTFSTLVGLVVVFDPTHVLLGLGLAIAAPFWARSKLRLSRGGVIAVGLIAFGALALYVAPVGSVPMLIAEIYALMFFCFLLSVVIEAGSVASRIADGSALKVSLCANGASYAVLLTVLLVGGFRTGAVVMTDVPLALALHTEYGRAHHAWAVTRVEEIMDWESSADESRWFKPTRWRRPYRELMAVQEWARDGDRANALALLRVVESHRRPTPDGLQFWTDARRAVGAGP